MNSLLYLLITLGILVTIHEYGHFWVARRCGVKVLKFSIGFGRTLWSRKGRDGTEYIIAMIPLGGFVKMLDEREGTVKQEELDYAFNRKSLAARTAIVAAGPLANLLFAIIAYAFIFMIGIPGIKPIIESVTADSPASYAQLVSGDEIVAVNGQETATWRSVNRYLNQAKTERQPIELTVRSNNIESQRSLELGNEMDDRASTSLVERLGINKVIIDFIPIIAAVTPDEPAAQAGLLAGDLIVTIDDQEVVSWLTVAELIQASPNKAMSFSVKRELETINLVITPLATEDNKGKIGVMVDSSKTTIPDELKSIERYGLLAALSKGMIQTWSFSAATLDSLAGMVTGRVSSKNIGGPITIAQVAGSSAEQGLISFVSFLAMISISLGLLNLLPIPVLDGGHLAMYFIEALRGKPLPEELQIKIQNIGIILLLLLMSLAFFNDLSRVFG